MMTEITATDNAFADIDRYLCETHPWINIKGIKRFAVEFLYFGLKEAHACLFAGLFVNHAGSRSIRCPCSSIHLSVKLQTVNVARCRTKCVAEVAAATIIASIKECTLSVNTIEIEQ